MGDHNLLFGLLRLLKYFSTMVLISTIVLLAYIPYQSSIKQSIIQSTSPLPQSAIDAARNPLPYTNPDLVQNGIHIGTGLAYDHNFKIVKAVCTRCHSAKLITQTSATREGWLDMIRWMQRTQGLEQLGEFEVSILDYLSTHYAPEYYGRRPSLDQSSIEWYQLTQ